MLMRNWALVGLGGLAAMVAAPFLGSVPVSANALPIWDQIEELATPTTSLVSIPGGAGSGLGSATELAGAGLTDVSGEVAGVTAAGGISLTPVGWALIAAAATAAGGYYAWQNRSQIIGFVNGLWNSLSSTQQSSLESSNSPGATISVPTSAIQSVLTGIQVSIPVSSSGTFVDAQAITVPSGWPQGAVFSVVLRPGPLAPTFGGTWTLGQGAWTAIGSGVSVSVNRNGSYAASGTGTGSSYSYASVSYGGLYGGNAGLGYTSTQFNFLGLQSGSKVYLESQYLQGSNSPGGFNSVPPFDSSGTADQWGTVANGVQSYEIPAIPAAGASAVPPSETSPTPTSSLPTFWPGTYNPVTQNLAPAGSPAPNPLVEPAPQPVNVPSGVPAPGFVTWLEDLFVPTGPEVESAILPIESAFANRIPFSYVSGLVAFLPTWADGVSSGGCATLPIPQFGFNGNSKNPSGAQSDISICSGSFMSGAFSLLKGAMTVMMWAFLLGWGVMMFRRLIR